jgi:nicotinamide-nucleotide amidase
MKEVQAAIITIGDELLIGQTVDTNSTWIAKELNNIGIWIRSKLAVGDSKEDIVLALQEASERHDIVIVTGGLGPTNDDITKTVLCEYFNTHLVVNEEARQNVINIFSKLNRPITETNLKQAELPANCTVFQNKRGTAPGMWFEKNGKIIISLPGVPHEMKGLLTAMKDNLQQQFQLPLIIHRTLLTAGQGESFLSDLLQAFEASLPPFIKLAYLPSYGLVRLRLTARGEEAAKMSDLTEQKFEELKLLVKEWLVVDEDISLCESVSRLLRAQGKKLCTAESCTGGYIAHLITSLPGSSDIYQGSVISYSNQSKVDILEVQPKTLEAVGAVSEETVRQMAAGALKEMKADYVIATSGIMGPGGGTDEKPVGTVWIAVGSRKEIRSEKRFFRFDRARNIELTGHTALNLLRLLVLEESNH